MPSDDTDMRNTNRLLASSVWVLVALSGVLIFASAVGHFTHKSSVATDVIRIEPQTLQQKMDEMSSRWEVDSFGPSGPLMSAQVSAPSFFIPRSQPGEGRVGYTSKGRRLWVSQRGDDRYSYLIVIIDVPGTADQDFVILRRSEQSD